MLSSGGPTVNSATRFEVLDALRGICALLVALYHFNSNGYIAQLPMVRNGWLFVDYFFVLSGFVIAHSYGARLADRTVSVGRFMGLRLGRIYPLHIAVLLAFVALELVLVGFGDSLSRYVSREAFSGSRNWEALLQSVLLFQSFGISGGEGWNVPAWSIAAEIWTYLLFAVIFLAGRRTMLVIAAALALICVVWLISYSADLHVTVNGGILRCIYGFGVGVLTYHAFRRFGGIGGSIWELIALTATIAFVSVAELKLTFVAPLVFGVMIFVLASQRGVVARVLSMRGFQLLGLVSYSLYMVHVFLQGRVGELLQLTKVAEISVNERGVTLLQSPPLVSDIITLAMIALLVLASFISYHLVEKPGRDLSRKWLSGTVSPTPYRG